METTPMKVLYARLSDWGLPRKYVRSMILPSWWEDEAAETEAGYSEALMLIARHVGLEISALRGGVVRPAEETPFKFKKVRGTADEELAIPRILATQVARLAALGAPAESPLPREASEIRERILQEGRLVDLDALVGFCWSIGIPVLHLSGLPKGVKKMQGLSARVGGRSVVVLSLQRKQPAWLLFVLAHELGHVALGQLEEGQVLIDEEIDRNDLAREEAQATHFALDLLWGTARAQFRAEDRWPNANDLAADARRFGQQLRIDPGHVILNYAHSMGPSFFAVGNAALKLLDPEADAVIAIRRQVASNLDWSRLPADSSEFLARMTGAAPPGP